MFFLGLACGIILGAGVTVIWYDDENKDDVAAFFKDDENGKN